MSRRIKLWPTAKSMLILVAFSFEAGAVDDACPTPTNRPDESYSKPAMQPRTLEPYSIRQTVVHYYDAPLGLGFLELIEGGDQYYYDWMFEVELPVWNTPNTARPLGWLSRGMIYTESGVEELTGAGMVETDYEHTSFIVWETQGDWLKLRLNNDLEGWAHRCHLRTANLKLEPVTWQTFLRRHADWLHFRKPVPHILRVSASVESERVTTIGLDHKIMLLDIRGDWMEIEVEQPDLTCSGPARDEDQITRRRGWVKWRDERGPWVYVYTRGC